jgi:hypothetical protein
VLRNTSPPFFKEGMPDEAKAEYGWGGWLALVIDMNEAISRNMDCLISGFSNSL